MKNLFFKSILLLSLFTSIEIFSNGKNRKNNQNNRKKNNSQKNIKEETNPQIIILNQTLNQLSKNTEYLRGNWAELFINNNNNSTINNWSLSELKDGKKYLNTNLNLEKIKIEPNKLNKNILNKYETAIQKINLKIIQLQNQKKKKNREKIQSKKFINNSLKNQK